MPHSGLPFRLLALAQPLEEDTETDDVFHTSKSAVHLHWGGTYIVPHNRRSLGSRYT